MPKSKNSYFKGLNQDNSRSKYDPSNYYNALNLRVITHDGLSTGSVENEKGNALTFSIPNVPAQTITHSDGTVANIVAQSNLKIIGWCAVDKYIVVFTTNETSSGTLTGSVGQIWKLEYDETTNTVLNLAGNFLTVADHLIYTGVVNFSTYYRIEAEGRYENSGIVRVYWTDFNNQLRTVNILDPNLFTLKPDILDTNPDVTFSMPHPIRVSSGYLPAGGKIQYAYRLISDSGAQTVVSPASPLVTLTTEDTNSADSYVDVRSDAPATSNSRAVTFSVEGIDTDYAIIEHIAVLFTSKDTPYMYKFGEDTIPSSGSMEVTIAGNETELVLTSPEFNLVSSGFSKCKTIDAKNNYLVAGNIVKEPAEISTDTWDSRAYRFNSSGDARLDDLSNPITLPTIGGIVDWDSVPVEHDAINPYNNEDDYNTWILGQSQCKYQSNGTTLGGEGKNVSYTFGFHRVVLDTNRVNSTKTYPWLDTDRITTGYTSGVLKADGTALVNNVSNEFDNFASPIIEALFTGYARGEVYRFGIQFYTKKGTVTFVNWIGDIRFPEPEDGYPIGNGIQFPQANNNPDLAGTSLGVRFTINVSAIAHLISGYRIVRAEREEPDMTRLGTGVIMLFDQKGENTPVTQQQSLYDTMGAVTSTNTIKTGREQLRWNGDQAGGAFNGQNRWHLPDLPGINLAGVEGGAHSGGAIGTKQHVILLSSLTTSGIRDALNFAFRDGDFIKTTGYFRSTAWMYRTDDSAGTLPDKQQRQAWVWKCRNFRASDHGREAFPIKQMSYYDGGIRVAGEARLDTIDDQDADFLNVSYGRTNGTTERKYPFGVGDDICHLMLVPWTNELGPYGAGMIAAESMQHTQNVRSGGWNDITIAGSGVFSRYTTQDWSFKEVAYIRPVINQYGGNSFEARSKTSYISTGHYQPITDAVQAYTNNLAFNVYGGDTTIHVMDRDYIQQYEGSQNQATQNPQGGLEDTGNLKLNVAVMFPCESRINLEFHGSSDIRFRTNRRGWNWGSGLGGHLQDRFTHDEFYTQRNNAEKKFIAKDFAVTVLEEYPHRLWISEPKIDGELVDSWKTFKSANILDVDGSYGPINKVINFQDKLTFYQERAIGIAPINERSLITDSSGVQLALGTGAVLQDFRYITATTGTMHQHSVVASTSALYHYDATLRKMFKLTQGAQPLSDMKGMSSFFANNVDNDIVNTDITLRDASLGGGIGVHSVFDFRHNRALFTFLNPKPGVNNFTIGFNEFMDSFESFYSFTPGIYLNTGRRLLSANPNNTSEAYLHDEGAYGTFYNAPTADTSITLLITPEGDFAKIFTNLEYNSEVSLNAIQQPAETLTSLEAYNDYQTTGNIPLIVGANIKRRIRHWRHIIGRDSTSSNQRARMRDYSIFLKLSYTNNNDKRLVLHDIIVSYTTARD